MYIGPIVHGHFTGKVFYGVEIRPKEPKETKSVYFKVDLGPNKLSKDNIGLH